MGSRPWVAFSRLQPLRFSARGDQLCWLTDTRGFFLPACHSHMLPSRQLVSLGPGPKDDLRTELGAVKEVCGGGLGRDGRR